MPIPDYPPPPFFEAMTSPVFMENAALAGVHSVTRSNIRPLPPLPVSSNPHLPPLPPPQGFSPRPPSAPVSAIASSDSDSENSYGLIPPYNLEEGRIQDPPLGERVRDWRRAVGSPKLALSSSDHISSHDQIEAVPYSQTSRQIVRTQSRGILDSDSEDEEVERELPAFLSTKRKHAPLSRIRALFSSGVSAPQERTMPAHMSSPHPLPHFFKSTTSLRSALSTPSLFSAIPSMENRSLWARTFISLKGKAREKVDDLPDEFLVVDVGSDDIEHNQLPTDISGCPSENIYQSLSVLLLTTSPMGNSREVKSIRNTLQEASRSVHALDPVSKLVHSDQYREQLIQAALDLGFDNAQIRDALRKDDTAISNLLRAIVASDAHKQAVLRLRGKEAQSLLDLIQTVLDRGSFSNPEDDKILHDAHRLRVRLSERSDMLPTSLIISGVERLENDAISGGGFADIYRGLYQAQQMICREALAWQRAQHPYVLPFLGIDLETFSSHICMISPWMEHGTILKYMEQNGHLNVNQHGLKYLHSQKIIHGDLRGANILIDSAWHVRIADFGLTSIADGTVATQTSHSGGTTRWMAPELHNPESFGFSRFQRTRASDVYSFACTCLEIYTRRPPFSELRDSAVLLKVMNGERPQLPSEGPGERMPSGLRSIIVLSWSQQPSDRPSMSEVVGLLETAFDVAKNAS